MGQLVLGWYDTDAFNLSILECKLLRCGGCSPSQPLLISPYWNVNQQVPAVHSICAVLLISPYWNVNYGSYGTHIDA